MRLSLILLTTVFFASIATADEARDVVERGMKVRTDKPELLDRQRCEIIVMDGKIMQGNQQEADATFELKAEWPTYQRWEREFTPSGQGKVRTIMALQGDKAWSASSIMPPVDMDIISTEDFKMEIHGRWLTTLYPLNDKAFTLVLLKDARVGDEEVAVVKASLRFRPDVSLSFSKKSGHLVKVAYQAREGGNSFRKSHVLSDYKEFEGLKLPTKWVDMRQVGGREEKLAEWSIKSYKFVDKLPADTFAKPEKK